MRTLLVEDDPVQREAFERSLQELGLDVTSVSAANDGLLAHLREPFDLLVLDWVLPGLDGLQLCRRIRAVPGGDRPYILVVTGRDRPSDLVEVLDAGADDYIAKPVDVALLRTRVRIAQRRQAAEAGRRQAQEALARSEVDFRRVIERCPLGIIAHAGGRLVYVNQAAVRTLGAPKQRLLGMALAELMAPDYRDVMARRAARFERTDVPPPPIEMEIERPGGSRAMLRFVPAARARHKDGRACFVILEDITERMRAQQQLRMTQYAMDHAGDAALWIREDGRITYANEAACAMSGFDRSELEAMSIVELDASLPSERWPAVRDALSSAGASQREGVLVHRDGHRIPIEMSTKSVAFDGERFLIVFARDLTGRKRLQANLQQADRLASVGSLAAGVAHEINNPLAYVIANLELMHEQLSAGDDEVAKLLPGLRRSVEEVVEGAHRVRRIVRDLRSFARAGDEEPRAVDIHDVLDTAIDIAGNEIRHRARLERRYGDIDPVLGNEGPITQVFVNLLVNAAHAISEDRAADQRITVSTGPGAPGWIEISIADTGTGIGPDIVSHIFDPFFTTKPQGAGTGLGLSICHGIVNSMGGTIDVSSELGVGTTFTLRLPAAGPQAVVDAGPTAEAPAPEAARSLRVLVVDDEPLICEGIERALGGHEVVSVHDGREAIARCEAEDFDLVLCDVMMPEVSGAEVFDRVCEARPELRERFVFMTGGAFTPKARAFLAGVDNDRLTKPFSLREIRSLVARRSATGS